MWQRYKKSIIVSCAPPPFVMLINVKLRQLVKENGIEDLIMIRNT